MYHVVARLSIDNLLVLARSFRVRDVEADHALGDVKCFIVHLMPMRWWSRSPRREDELCDSQAVIWTSSARYDQLRNNRNRPVRDPSSMIRHVIGPSLNVSPALMGTKLIFSSGMGTTPAMMRALPDGFTGSKNCQCRVYHRDYVLSYV